MNRRSFITKALAGLAAVPLIGKLAGAQHVDDIVWEPSDPVSVTHSIVFKDTPEGEPAATQKSI